MTAAPAAAARGDNGVPFKSKNKKKREPIHFKQMIHLAHRFSIFLCAIIYIFYSFGASYTAFGLLRGHDNPTLPVETVSYDLLATYVGTTTLRDSVLVKNALGDRTDPVSGILYLKTVDTASFSRCADTPESQLAIYSDVFQRSLYAAVTEHTSYHIEMIRPSEIELIAPIVDCTSSDTSDDDTSTNRFFFLVRQRTNPANVSLIVVSLSNQEYTVSAQGQNGPASVATIQVVNDMRAKDVDSHFLVSIGYPYGELSFRVFEYVNTTTDGLWSLENVPRDDDEIVKIVETACRDGFYIKAETEQSNINNQLWRIDTDALLVVSRWQWVSKPVLHDSWAWVHAVQFFIGIKLLSNLAILCLATFRNFSNGKWWIGDAFVSISTSQIVNGVAVLVAWFMNEYWALHEFSFVSGYQLSGATEIAFYDPPMRADLITIYFSACGLIGYLFQERIDPFFAAICFSIGYNSRMKFIQWVPAIHEKITEYAMYSYMRGVGGALDGQDEISPMRSWSTHPIGKRNYGFVFQCLFPIFITLVLVIGYVLVRKLYRRLYPDRPRNLHGTVSTRERAENETTILTQKRVLTLFEVATGAELENRFGVVSDYETCLYIKGMKFASADGIYSTGFVIANKKFLLQTSDFWSIVFMKLIRRRYKNVYVYDVNGSTVQQRARLVYPHTLTFTDLANINVSVLS